MPAKFEVTVNGQPLRTVIAEEIRVEANHHRKVEVGTIARQVKAHIVTNRIRNTSKSRSGRVRVICANGVFL